MFLQLDQILIMVYLQDQLLLQFRKQLMYLIHLVVLLQFMLLTAHIMKMILTLMNLLTSLVRVNQELSLIIMMLAENIASR